MQWCSPWTCKEQENARCIALSLRSHCHFGRNKDNGINQLRETQAPPSVTKKRKKRRSSFLASESSRSIPEGSSISSANQWQRAERFSVGKLLAPERLLRQENLPPPNSALEGLNEHLPVIFRSPFEAERLVARGVIVHGHAHGLEVKRLLADLDGHAFVITVAGGVSAMRNRNARMVKAAEPDSAAG